MRGTRHIATGADGATIGLLTAGTGPCLLLVHGGMGRLERSEPVWESLAERWCVTAMDRRGRGTSGDTEPYDLAKEYEDIAAVARHLTEECGPVDVFAHSYGATCTLGAAALDAPFRRIALYEPPGPPTVPREWVDRVTALIAEGQVGRAVFHFLTEIVGLTAEQFEALRAAPGAGEVLPIAAATIPREAEALTHVDLVGLAARIDAPVLLLLGSASPPWAGAITRVLGTTLAHGELVLLTGCGHEAIDSAPDLVVDALGAFLGRAP